MESLQNIRTFDPLAVLAHPQRLAILRFLMVGNGTLSQIARAMNTYPAKVRHHLKQLEEAGLVSLQFTQVAGGFVEKYYRATAQAFVINLAIVPERPQQTAVMAWGSHDLGLELLADRLQNNQSAPDLYTVPVGSLDGLMALRQGVCQVAGCHLLDTESGDYNRPFIRHLFPDEPMRLLTLAHRQQGLLVMPGNPMRLQTLADLTREDVVFVNRNRGAGTRLWLDRELRRQGIAGAAIDGYEKTAVTHVEVAQAIAMGDADVGLGVEAAARRFGLDFVPLFTERYDLALPEAQVANPLLQPLLDELQTAVFRQELDAMGGYDTSQTGAEIRVEV